MASLFKYTALALYLSSVCLLPKFMVDFFTSTPPLTIVLEINNAQNRPLYLVNCVSSGDMASEPFVVAGNSVTLFKSVSDVGVNNIGECRFSFDSTTPSTDLTISWHRDQFNNEFYGIVPIPSYDTWVRIPSSQDYHSRVVYGLTNAKRETCFYTGKAELPF